MKKILLIPSLLALSINAEYLVKNKTGVLSSDFSYNETPSSYSQLYSYGTVTVNDRSYSGLLGGKLESGAAVYSAAIDKTKKTYIEITIPSDGPPDGYMIGLASQSQLDYGYGKGVKAYSGNKNIFRNGTAVSAGSYGLGVGVIIGVLYTPEDRGVTWYINGVYAKNQPSLQSWLVDSETWHLKVGSAAISNSASATINFGQEPFVYPISDAVGIME